jgi:hypothetical protein
MRCAEAIRLIGRAEDGQVGFDVLETLMAHLDACRPCRFEAETQIVVKRVLASRPDEPVSQELSQKIAASLDVVMDRVSRTPGGWRKQLDALFARVRAKLS